MGVKTFYNGRNNILTDKSNQKVSGSAFRFGYGNSKRRYLYHGTLFFNVDLEMMTHVLYLHKLKLISNSVDSIRSRAINLKSMIPDITEKKEEESIVNEFLKVNGLIIWNILLSANCQMNLW